MSENLIAGNNKNIAAIPQGCGRGRHWYYHQKSTGLSGGLTLFQFRRAIQLSLYSNKAVRYIAF